MPNRNYRRGSRKEYQIISDLKKEGFEIAQRSRGSHSPIDIFVINREKRLILLMQSKRKLSEKMSYTDPILKAKIEKEFYWLNGTWEVEFKVI